MFKFYALLNSLNILKAKNFRMSVNRDNLKYKVIAVNNKEEKLTKILNILNSIDGKGIIYAGRIRDTEELTDYLTRNGISSESYYSTMTADEKKRVQNNFSSDHDCSVRIICATNAFGMGIDKANIRFVIHYSMPGSLEEYYQEAGREGRDGEIAYCTLLYDINDVYLQQYFINDSIIKEHELISLRDYILKSPFYSNYYFFNKKEFELDGGLQDSKIKSALRILESFNFIKRMVNLPMNIKIKYHLNKFPNNEMFLSMLYPNNNIITCDFCNENNISPIRLMAELNKLVKSKLISISGTEDVSLIYVESKALFLKNNNFDTRYIQQALHIKQKSHKLKDMIFYCTTDRCRNQFIREYFDEELQRPRKAEG